MSAATTKNELVIESKGGPVTYKAVLERNKGGDITQLFLPADSGSVLSDLNDIFFHGTHHNEYQKPWQQDWQQTSGFKYDVSGQPQGQPVTVKTEVAFAKAAPAEMPPVVTLRSPGPEARWMDEKGEVAKYKLGETVKLLASAVNADGSPVADRDISWEIRIDAWWKRRPFVLQGAQGSYPIPQAANEEEKTVAQARPLLAVIKVTAKGNNGTEATEHFAMLVAK